MEIDKSCLDRDLVCVLFPGIVKNDDKAIQCLGGIRNVSQVYCQPTKKRLGLSYQPENPFVKRIHADTKKTSGILIKVKVKKTKVNNEVKREIISTTVLGRVNKIFKFESMCDFQYMPVHLEGPGSKPQCILEKILPSGTDTSNFLLEPSPLFIVPSNFTRFDKPTNYAYTDKRYPDRRDSPGRDEDEHKRNRTERSVPLARYDFNLVDALPAEPHQFYIHQKDAKIEVFPQLAHDFETVKKNFEERPIWSQNLIKFHTKIRTTMLKVILPCLAIYMKNGPWRMLWVRFGYDPRQEPGARIYQTLDFRLRHQAGVRSMVMTRDQIVHYKKADRVRHAKRRPEEPHALEDVNEGAVYFRPGMAPTQRQIFYQYCDIKLPEVEAAVAAAPPPGALCHAQRGWLPPGTDKTCRDHIFRCVKQTLLATHSADLKFEQGSSDEGSNSEDERNEDEASNSNT